MSLNELIEELTAARDNDPLLGVKPVWVMNHSPHAPILRLGEAGGYGLEIFMQRGFD